MRQSAIAFTSRKGLLGGSLTLEGVISTPVTGGSPSPALLVCHPHPLFGGSMENAVVTALCRAADGLGMATLRFNFRGVGGSQGSFSKGRGEARDLGAALSVLRRWPGVDPSRVAVAGYSFGAGVLLRNPPPRRRAAALVLVAPPVSAVRESPLRRDGRPRLFVTGEADRVSPPLDLQRALDAMAPPVRFVQVPGADHSLRGHEAEVGRHVAQFLVEALGLEPAPEDTQTDMREET